MSSPASSLLRSARAKLLSSSASLSRTFAFSPSSTSSSSRSFSSLPRSSHGVEWRSPLSPLAQIGTVAPFMDLFLRKSATVSAANENPSEGNLTSLPKPRGGEFGKIHGLSSLNDPTNKSGSDPNKINPMRYKACGQDTNVLARAGYGNGSSRVWAAKGPMPLGVNAVMAKSFERSVVADTLALPGHKRYMSDIPSTITETKPYSFRPLSPHLPVYQPQISSTLSILNRISGALLAGVVLLFYMIYMKTGLIGLTYDSFYKFLFYSSRLNLLAVEVSALALTYHVYSAIRHLVAIK